MNFFEYLHMIGGGAWVYGGTFILVLSILVFVHEWGHYIVARMCGVKVESFSIGFGKELFGWTDKNDTRWKLSLIPLGGYVKLFGDTDPASAGHTEDVQDGGKTRPMTEAEKAQAFYAKSVGKRSAIVFAGPAINYIFAIILMAGLFIFNGQPVTPPVAAAVIGGSSAEKHGFEAHDKIVSIDGVEIVSFEDIRREMMIALDVKKHFVVERDGQLVDIYASPEKVTQEDRFGFKHSRGLLGLISPRHAVSVENIKTIDGVAYDDVEAVRTALNIHMGDTFPIEVMRGDELEKLLIHPLAEFNEDFNNPESDSYDILFISNTQANMFVKRGLGEALVKAGEESWNITRGTLEALGQIITGTRSATELGGVIRIGALAGDMAQQGLIALIMFTALLSINLGFINLLPIPMLDGGHLVFYAAEAVMRRPVPEVVQEYAFRFGLVFLVGIMVFANINDIMQLIL